MTRSADLVITGARLETMADAPAPGDSLAVSDGRIVAIGRADEIIPLRGDATRHLQLAGETVLPGFGDAHVHPISGGLLAIRCSLHDHADAASYLDAIARYAAAHPTRSWIEGSGWAMPAFPGGNPTREALDRIVPDRPVYLESRDGHSAWVNSRALELAGIGAGTRDPADGRIERREDGTPAGTLHEGAMQLVAGILSPPSHAELVAAISAAQRHLHGLGITTWQDAYVPEAELAAYRAVADAGQLTARVVAAQAWDPAGGLDQVARVVELAAAAARPGLRADSVKFFVDGIIENGTALMIEPYHDPTGRPTAGRGLPMIDPELLRAAVVELDRVGVQSHFHAIGDGAVRLALDAVADARAANGLSDTRPHLAHLEVIHPGDIGRFAGLDATANIQPIWAVYEEQMRDLRVPVLGPERTGWQFPFESLRLAGARLAGGSDWTVSTPDPLLEVESAVHRVRATARADDPFLPAERLDLDAALRAYTIGSAYVNHLDHETGSLEVGKAADLVILDRDLRSPDAGPIGDARVRHTFVAGLEVYRA